MKASYPEELSLCHRIVSEKSLSLSLFKIQAANFNGMGKHRKHFIYKGDCHWFKRKIGVMGMVLKKILPVVSQDQSPGKHNLE